MIDTHCHLTFPDFAGRVASVLAEARNVGVAGAITVGTTSAGSRECLELSRKHDHVWCTAGVHPLYSDEPVDWAQLVAVARDPRCVAWGELGLDHHYDRPPRDLQRRILREQLAVITDAQIAKPIVVHCRESFDDLLAEFRATTLPPEQFVFHCFTGGPAEARQVLDFGAWISFTGIVTFKNSRAIQEAARLVPSDRIMIETDAPFLTPEPHRKVRPNEPKFSLDTARFVAEIRGTPWPEFHETINRNTHRFFGIPLAECAVGDTADDRAAG